MTYEYPANHPWHELTKKALERLNRDARERIRKALLKTPIWRALAGKDD